MSSAYCTENSLLGSPYARDVVSQPPHAEKQASWVWLGFSHWRSRLEPGCHRTDSGPIPCHAICKKIITLQARLSLCVALWVSLSALALPQEQWPHHPADKTRALEGWVWEVEGGPLVTRVTSAITSDTRWHQLLQSGDSRVAQVAASCTQNKEVHKV